MQPAEGVGCGLHPKPAEYYIYTETQQIKTLPPAFFHEYFGVNVLPPGSVSFKNGCDPPSVPSPLEN